MVTTRPRLPIVVVLAALTWACTLETTPGATYPGTSSTPTSPPTAPGQPSGSSRTTASTEGPGTPENVMVLLMDDLGPDKLQLYEAPRDYPPPPTPTIDALAEEGVRFRNAYAYPVCSPARAALLTGRHARREGIGAVIFLREESVELSVDSFTIPRMLESAPEPWSTAIIGKWHLTSFLPPASGPMHPLLVGFDYHAGSLGNLHYDDISSPDDYLSYYHYERAVNGKIAYSNNYATTDTVDDALAWIGRASEPWYLQVSFNAPHTPIAEPPSELHTRTNLSERWSVTDAMIEAMDTEMGRLLESMPADVHARTTILLTADNGTNARQLTPPLVEHGFRAKGHAYELGVRVPFIVAGPRVSQPGSTSDGLVHLVDILPTVAEIAGVDLTAVPGAPEIDGTSLLPYLEDPSRPSLRQYLFSEIIKPDEPPFDSEESTIRDERYKLLRVRTDMAEAVDQLFELEPDQLIEGDNLLEGTLTPDQQAAYDRLSAEMDALIARLSMDN